MRTLAFLLAALISCVSFAQDRTLTITDAGYYWTAVSDDGTPQYVQFETVVDLRGDKPIDPKDPDGQVDKDLVAKAQSWAAAINDPQAAQGIAAVYAHIRGALSDATLNPTNFWTPLRQATDSAVGIFPAAKNWSSFRTNLSAWLTEAKQRGRLQTAKDVERVLLSVQHGIELSADGSTAISMDQLVQIASLTNVAIDGVTK